MLDNIHLYILIGILGSITPILDKLNLQNIEWYNYLFFREIIFILCLVPIFFIGKNNIFNKLKDFDNSKKLLLLGGSIVSFIYVALIFKTFNLEFKKESISKIIMVMIISTIIFTFLVDKFYFNTSFNNFNYLGILFLILGLYLIKGF